MSPRPPRLVRLPDGTLLPVQRVGTCPACRNEVYLALDARTLSGAAFVLVHERALCTGYDRDPESEYGQAVVWTPRRGAS